MSCQNFDSTKIYVRKPRISFHNVSFQATKEADPTTQFDSELFACTKNCLQTWRNSFTLRAVVAAHADGHEDFGAAGGAGAEPVREARRFVSKRILRKINIQRIPDGGHEVRGEMDRVVRERS